MTRLDGRWLDLAKIAAAFLAVGPLLGLSVFAIGVSFASRDPFVGLFFIIYGLLFAHFVGGGPALVAGVLVAILAWWRAEVVPVWLGAVAGLLTVPIIESPRSLLRPDAVAADQALAVLIVATPVLAAAGMTRLTRRWHAPRSDPD
jgi:hypothetical protein